MPDDGTRYLVMDEIDGHDIYRLERPINGHETADLIAQVARLHTLRLVPEPVRDPWAIPQLAATATAVEAHLDGTARSLIAAVIDAVATAGQPAPLPERLTALADQYARHHLLTRAERAALPAYGFAAAAMEFLGAAREYHVHRDRRAETLRLLEIGRDGMRECVTAGTT